MPAGGVGRRSPPSACWPPRAPPPSTGSARSRHRNTLYREIAVANGHPEWEDRIRATFAERWIDKARSGWHYRGDDDDWIRK